MKALYGLCRTDLAELAKMLPRKSVVVVLTEDTEPRPLDEYTGIVACFGTRAFGKFRPSLEPSGATVFILDSMMRFRGTNIALVDKDGPLTKDGVKGLLMTKTAPLTFRKPKPIMQIALEKNRDNSLLAVMLHTKHRHSRDPKKQEEFQAAFMDAVLYSKYDVLEGMLEEPARTKLMSIVKSDLATKLSAAVNTVRNGKVAVELAATQHDVSSYDISYTLSYLSKEKK